MAKRRDFLKAGTALTGGVLGMTFFGKAKAETTQFVPTDGLVPPDGLLPSIVQRPSPPSTPFLAPLYVMPIAQPVDPASLNPAPDPNRHQRYNEFLPKKFYVQNISEILWQYSPEAPFNVGSWSYGFNGATPGETFHAYYGEPHFVRRFNILPPVGSGNVRFALPSVTIHLHNAHTASESDGNPADFFDPGEFWDHHYANFAAGNDPLQRMTTLWYHDHRLDFTAPNVYAGLSGFNLLFDDQDTNNENDSSKGAWRLPSGKYDVPLILHDVQFDANGQVVFDFYGAPYDTNNAMGQFATIFGMLGDTQTVNRRIRPYFRVEPRKYRFRILNGGPSRFYDLYLKGPASGKAGEQLIVLSEDGNFHPAPFVQPNVVLGVAQRVDVIVDFSNYKPGDQIIMYNRMEMIPTGEGPTGRQLDPGDQVMRFDVVASTGPDPSRVPNSLRPRPAIDLSQVRRTRVFDFDYTGGLWTINGKLMDPNRIDARIEQGSAEIWTLRNKGNMWSHPIHTHFEEFQILEINGVPVPDNSPLKTKKDVAVLYPNTEIKFYGHWRDFLGKYVMHCHNVVHEDHAMMIRWDIVPPGQGD